MIIPHPQPESNSQLPSLFPTGESTDSNRSLNVFDMLLSSQFAGLVTWDHQRPLCILSAVNVKKYGLAPEQIGTGYQRWIDLVVPEHRDRFIEHLEWFYSSQSRGTHSSSNVDYVIANTNTNANANDDSRYTVRQETFGLYDKDGILLSLKSLILDLPSSTDGASDMEQENQRFRDIVDAIPSWVFIKNKQHQYEFVNHAYAAVYGIPAHECVGKTAIELGADPECAKGNPEKGIVGFWAADDEVLATGKPVHISAEPIIVNGETKYLQTMKKPLSQDTLFGFVHDVSYLKTIENKIAIELRDNKTINAINEVLRSGKKVSDTFQRVCQLILDSLDADKAEIQFSDRGKGQTSVVATKTAEKETTSARIHVRRVAVSIEFANQQIGTLAVDRTEGKADFSQQDEKLLQSVANQIAFQLNQRKLVEEIEYRAYHDSLTDLANREKLVLELQEAFNISTHKDQFCGLVFVDLDGFKRVNDTLGHHAGDLLLVAVASRLAAVTHPNDLLARLGGDEFAILLTNLPDKETGVKIADQLLNVFKKSFSILGRTLHLRASAGVSFFPDDGKDASTLLQNADAAMYHAKGSGKNYCCTFTQEMADEVSRRLGIESDLRRAIGSNQLSLGYQPKFDLRTGKAVGVEALMRWDHPERGSIGSATFIEVAEESGYIIELGQWAINEACQAAVRWQAELGHSLNLAVNVSPLQLRREEFVDEVLATVARTGIRPDQLELELTETYLMKQIDEISPRLQILRDHGIKIAIDHFGTGYSCLSYLKNLPVDVLKIDGSFVQQLDSDELNLIMRTIVHLAQMMGLKTVAEGIETDKQRELSAKYGVDLGQGHLFSRTLSEQETLELFQKQL